MRRHVLSLLVLASVVAPLAGCGHRLTGVLKPPQPPDTRIFVQGPVDTVNHVVHLYWFGTDPDGYIRGFEYRFFTSPAESAATGWTFTRKTDMVFTVQDSTGFTAPTFEVRAVDSTMVAPPADAAPGAPGGLRDPTPAREDFEFSNYAPVVKLNGFLIRGGAAYDTTFASATVTWSVTDQDNDLASARFRIWLDGRENNPDIVAGRSFTVPTDRFAEADGHTIVSRQRQLFIQAIDDGGMAGNVDSTRWNVRAPATGSRHGRYGRLLIVNDMDPNYTFHKYADSLYIFNNPALRDLAGSYSVLSMYPKYPASQPFRSAKDLEQTCKLFDAVVWYVGGHNNFDAFETYLNSYQDGVGAYLDSGGNFYLDGLNLLDAYRARGVFSHDFARRYLGIDGYVQQFYKDPTTGPDSTAAWYTSGTAGVIFSFAAGSDTLDLRQSPSPGVRGCVVSDPSYGLVVAPPAAMAGTPLFPMVIGVSVPQPLGGRAIVLTFPLSWSQPFPMDPRTPGILAKIFGLLGLTEP